MIVAGSLATFVLPLRAVAAAFPPDPDVIAGTIAGFTRLLTGATAQWHVEPRSTVPTFSANTPGHASGSTSRTIRATPTS